MGLEPAVGLTGGDPLVELLGQGVIPFAQGKAFAALRQRFGKWHKKSFGVAQCLLFRFRGRGEGAVGAAVQYFLKHLRFIIELAKGRLGEVLLGDLHR